MVAIGGRRIGDRLNAMSIEAMVGLSISGPLAILAGGSMIVWRRRFADWYSRLFTTMYGRIGRPFARASTPLAVSLVGCFILTIGMFNLMRLAFGFLGGG